MHAAAVAAAGVARRERERIVREQQYAELLRVAEELPEADELARHGGAGVQALELRAGHAAVEGGGVEWGERGCCKKTGDIHHAWRHAWRARVGMDWSCQDGRDEIRDGRAHQPSSAFLSPGGVEQQHVVRGELCGVPHQLHRLVDTIALLEERHCVVQAIASHLFWQTFFLPLSSSTHPTPQAIVREQGWC